MSEEQNRFSLRKLSVGLASVLIGVSIFGTSQTVKADTVADQNTSAVTSNAQSSDTQENKNTVKSNFSSDNQANNVKSNLIQTQVEGKKDRKQDSVPKTQEATDGSNLDAEKSIIRTSSLQEPDNQSNNHAEDNSQSQLDITKNSQQLDQKELATNLTETKSADDLATQKDPSNLNANDFADGTKWTTAGWTRTNPQYVAKSSNLKLTSFDKNNQLTTGIGNHGTNISLDFTVDKNDLTKNRKILVGSVQAIYNQKQDLSKETQWTGISIQPQFDNGLLGNNNDVSVDNKKVGHLEFDFSKAEADIYFISDIDSSDAVSDISAHYQTVNGPLMLTVAQSAWTETDYAGFTRNGFTFPLNQTLITNADIYNHTITVPTSYNSYDKKDLKDSSYYYADSNYGAYGISGSSYSDTPLEYVMKFKSTDPTAIPNGIFARKIYHYLDKDGKITDFNFVYEIKDMPNTNLAENISPIDMLNQTKMNSTSTSKQSDGSYLVCFKLNPNSYNIDQNQLRTAVKKSEFVNLTDPAHKNQIINNTLNYYNNNKHAFMTFDAVIGFNGDQSKSNTTWVTWLNPGPFTGEWSTSPFTGKYQHTVNGVTDTKGETYRQTSVSYIDNITNKKISADTLIGRKNQGLTYTITIPKGYLLDTNTDGTNYKWNADHTTITYTFADDQAKNDASPIEIHLKHKHTAVTDSSQLQTTGKRTITITLPHQNKPMIIVQTIGWQRTGTYDEVIEASKGLDEAEKEGIYTAWVFDANTSNVTVDGQPSTQYQAYVLKDGVVNYAPIKLPHINGYKTKLIQDKANPAMFMVSFMAVPSENKPSLPNEETPSKSSAPADNPNKPAGDLQQRVATELNNNDSGWTMPETSSTYTVEVPDDNTIDLSNLVIAKPIHAQTRTQIRVNKRFKLSKKHSIKHLKHRKKAVRQFKKYRL